jgi:hypothetical protein
MQASMLLKLSVEFANGERPPVSSLKSELRSSTHNKYILLKYLFLNGLQTFVNVMDFLTV